LWVVVGLGNPGRHYSGTRHNVGFIFIKRVAKYWKVKLRKKKYLSKAVLIEREQGKVLLAMPQVYMNNSGLAVKRIIEWSGVRSDQLIIVYDDLDIPLGEIRIRKQGSAGTHNGMSSIIREIQTTKFPRIRVGIGPLITDGDAVNYVLSPFKEAEKPLMEESIKRAQEALEFILNGDIEKAMNMYNCRIQNSEFRSRNGNKGNM